MKLGLLFFGLLAFANADTLTLRNGETVTGTWAGIDAQQVSFLVNDQIRSFPRADVLKVTFGAIPQKIELGMTLSEVTGILGQPQSVSDAGPNQIYSFKNLKVTFVDGKVADVK